MHADLLAAKKAGPVTGGLIAFLIIVIGFLLVSGLVIWHRTHRDATRLAVYVEDTRQPVRHRTRRSKQ